MSVGHAKLGVIKRTTTAEQPRSYIVTVGNKDYRRNRRNLLKVLELTRKADSEILEQIHKMAELVIGTPTQAIKQVVVARSGRVSKPVSRYQAKDY